MKPLRVVSAGLLASMAIAIAWSLLVVPVKHQTLPASPQTLQSALGGSVNGTGFDRALKIRAFRFPEDHGAHLGYRNEWWYITGNLATDSGREFGFQLTFFRIALVPNVIQSPSHWRTSQIYMAHFALSDISSGQFFAFERFGRGAAGVAGVTNPPLKVWLDHWYLMSLDESGFPMRLHVAQGDIALDLELSPEKPVVLNGDRGLSRKSADPGNASYYYSIPRLRAVGTLDLNGSHFTMDGKGWLDREWSTSALAANQQGWDWFALQLDDGRDLMIYRLRRTDGSADPMSAGTLIDIEGQATHLGREDMDFQVLESWTSKKTGVRYPLRWKLSLLRERLVLEVEPALRDQEMDLSVRYWEGAVRVKGREGGRALRGKGYMELAGYAL